MSPTPSWSADLLGPGQVEAARAVVQQRRIVGPQGGGDEGVGLMAGRADRVEAASLGTQPAGGVVEVAAGDLGVEQHVEAAPRERRTRGDRLVRYGARRSRHVDRRHGVEQQRLGLVESMAVVDAADALPAHGTDITVEVDFGTGTPKSHSVSENGATNMTMTGIADDLTADSTAPDLRTELPGPNASAIIARDEAVTSPSLTRVYPLVVRRGRGCVIEDVDGNRFLDFNAGIAVVAAGHAHPDVNAAIHAQVDDVLHYCSSDFYLPAYADVSERLARLAPMSGDARTFLSNSGTEAVEAALKLARHHTGRPNAIAFLGGFHGRSLGSLSLTASKSRQRCRLRHPDAGQLPRPVLGPVRRGRD